MMDAGKSATEASVGLESGKNPQFLNDLTLVKICCSSKSFPSNLYNFWPYITVCLSKEGCQGKKPKNTIINYVHFKECHLCFAYVLYLYQFCEKDILTFSFILTTSTFTVVKERRGGREKKGKEKNLPIKKKCSTAFGCNL